MDLEYLAAQRSSIDLEFATLSGNPDFTNIFAGLADLSALILIFDYMCVHLQRDTASHCTATAAHRTVIASYYSIIYNPPPCRYRGYRSVAIFVRYWGNSAVGLPLIKAQKFRPGGPRENCAERVGRCVTGPYTMVVVMAAMTLGAGLIAGTVYVPWLQHYQAACNDGERSDTLISANAYALIFNFATSLGTVQMQRYTKNYDSARSEICGDLVTTTSEQHNSKELLFQSYQNSWGESTANLALVHDCMDIESAGHNFLDLTHTVEGSASKYARMPLKVLICFCLVC
jgi:hypothetical protein